MPYRLYNELEINDLLMKAHPSGGEEVVRVDSGEGRVEDSIEAQIKNLDRIYRKPTARVLANLFEGLKGAGSPLAETVALLKKAVESRDPFVPPEEDLQEKGQVKNTVDSINSRNVLEHANRPPSKGAPAWVTKPQSGLPRDNLGAEVVHKVIEQDDTQKAEKEAKSIATDKAKALARDAILTRKIQTKNFRIKYDTWIDEAQHVVYVRAAALLDRTQSKDTSSGQKTEQSAPVATKNTPAAATPASTEEVKKLIEQFHQAWASKEFTVADKSMNVTKASGDLSKIMAKKDAERSVQRDFLKDIIYGNRGKYDDGIRGSAAYWMQKEFGGDPEGQKLLAGVKGYNKDIDSQIERADKQANAKYSEADLSKYFAEAAKTFRKQSEMFFYKTVRNGPPEVADLHDDEDMESALGDVGKISSIADIGLLGSGKTNLLDASALSGYKSLISDYGKFPALKPTVDNLTQQADKFSSMSQYANDYDALGGIIKEIGALQNANYLPAQSPKGSENKPNSKTVAPGGTPAEKKETGPGNAAAPSASPSRGPPGEEPQKVRTVTFTSPITKKEIKDFPLAYVLKNSIDDPYYFLSAMKSFNALPNNWTAKDFFGEPDGDGNYPGREEVNGLLDAIREGTRKSVAEQHGDLKTFNVALEWLNIFIQEGQKKLKQKRDSGNSTLEWLMAKFPEKMSKIRTNYKATQTILQYMIGGKYSTRDNEIVEQTAEANVDGNIRRYIDTVIHDFHLEQADGPAASEPSDEATQNGEVGDPGVSPWKDFDAHPDKYRSGGWQKLMPGSVFYEETLRRQQVEPPPPSHALRGYWNSNNSAWEAMSGPEKNRWLNYQKMLRKDLGASQYDASKFPAQNATQPEAKPGGPTAPPEPSTPQKGPGVAAPMSPGRAQTSPRVERQPRSPLQNPWSETH